MLQSGDRIRVMLNNKIELIDVAAGATSPQTIVFVVPANGLPTRPSGFLDQYNEL